MKKLLLFLTLFTASISFSQVTIWQEDFENSCTSGCSAAGVNTGNGAWTLTDNSPSQDGCGFTNTPNTFYVSCAENGNDAGQCGTTCSNDESLHVSAQTTGDLGAAYMGLQLLEREKSVFELAKGVQPDLSGNDYILERQLKPEARLDVIQALKTAGIQPTSMIDVSDGISSDLLHITKSSGIGASIYEEKIHA